MRVFSEPWGDPEDQSLGAERERPAWREGKGADDKVHLPHTDQRLAGIQEDINAEAEEAEACSGHLWVHIPGPPLCDLGQVTVLPFLWGHLSLSVCLSLPLSPCHALEWVAHRHDCSTCSRSHSWLDQVVTVQTDPGSLTLHLEFGLKVSRWLEVVCVRGYRWAGSCNFCNH